MRTLIVALVILAAAPVLAQTAAPPMPADYAAVLQTLGRQGDCKEASTPVGFGGWVALTRGEHGMDVMMSDLVLTESVKAAVDRLGERPGAGVG